MKKIIFILPVVLIMIIGCKKTNKTLEKIYGYYTLKTFNVDGVDSLAPYDTKLGRKFWFYNDKNDNSNHLVIYKTTLEDTTGEISFFWTLNDNNIIEIQKYNYTEPGGILPFISSIVTHWDIGKLEDNELDMSTVYNGKNYLVDLVKN